MFRRLLGLVVFVFALLASARASAATVRDAEKFSVDIAKARICWVTPRELRDENCDGLTPDAVPEPQDGKARIIAMGLVRLEEPGAAPDLALVMVMHVPLPVTIEPTEITAKEYGEGAQKAIAKDLRKGARMRPSTNTRLVRFPEHRYPLIRSVLDADGIPNDGDDRLLEHQIHIAGVADDGMYSVAWLCRRKDAKTIEAYADAVGPSFAMTKPGATAKDFELIVSVVILVLTLLIGGFISLVVIMARKKKERQYAQQGAYGQYGSYGGYPPPAWHPASVDGSTSQQPPPPADARSSREWWDRAS